MSETPEVTPVNEWTVPNQDKLERVVDARLTKNSEGDASEVESEDTTPNDTEAQEQTPEVPAEEPKTDESNS